MGCGVVVTFTIKLNEYFLDTFIEILDDELNKLEHKNSKPDLPRSTLVNTA